MNSAAGQLRTLTQQIWCWITMFTVCINTLWYSYGIEYWLWRCFMALPNIDFHTYASATSSWTSPWPQASVCGFCSSVMRVCGGTRLCQSPPLSFTSAHALGGAYREVGLGLDGRRPADEKCGADKQMQIRKPVRLRLVGGNASMRFACMGAGPETQGERSGEKVGRFLGGGTPSMYPTG